MKGHSQPSMTSQGRASELISLPHSLPFFLPVPVGLAIAKPSWTSQGRTGVDVVPIGAPRAESRRGQGEEQTGRSTMERSACQGLHGAGDTILINHLGEPLRQISSLAFPLIMREKERVYYEVKVNLEP